MGKKSYKKITRQNYIYSVPLPGIMQTNRFEDGTTSYRVGCSCNDEQHDLNMWVEADPEWVDAQGVGQVSVKIYTKVETPIWKEGFSRIKEAAKLLFFGRSEFETAVLMTKHQALAFSATVDKAVRDLDEVVRKKDNAEKPQGPLKAYNAYYTYHSVDRCSDFIVYAASQSHAEEIVELKFKEKIRNCELDSIVVKELK